MDGLFIGAFIRDQRRRTSSLSVLRAKFRMYGGWILGAELGLVACRVHALVCVYCRVLVLRSRSSAVLTSVSI